jgi:hypothetical protein
LPSLVTDEGVVDCARLEESEFAGEATSTAVSGLEPFDDSTSMASIPESPPVLELGVVVALGCIYVLVYRQYG